MNYSDKRSFLLWEIQALPNHFSREEEGEVCVCVCEYVIFASSNPAVVLSFFGNSVSQKKYGARALPCGVK